MYNNFRWQLGAVFIFWFYTNEFNMLCICIYTYNGVVDMTGMIPYPICKIFLAIM